MWVARITDGTRSTKIIGYTFEVNDAASAEAALDKVCAFELMDSAGIPAVKHRLLEVSTKSSDMGWLLPYNTLPPVVIKPNRGSGGTDVLLCRNQEELRANLASLSAKHQTIAYSPFIQFDSEYRVVVLNRNAVLIFEKIRAETQEPRWKFNLNLGGIPRIVHEADDEYCLLAELGIRAADELGILFGAVDIAVSPGGKMIMEVNDAFSLIYFSNFSKFHFHLAGRLYLDVLGHIFTN